MFDDVQKNIVKSKQGGLIQLSHFLRSLQKDDFKGGGLAHNYFRSVKLQAQSSSLFLNNCTFHSEHHQTPLTCLPEPADLVVAGVAGAGVLGRPRARHLRALAPG